MKTIEIKNFQGLEYISVVLPVKSSKGRDIVSIEMSDVELKVAKIVVEQRFPLRGIEVAFLRKVAGLSYDKMGGRIGMTGNGIMKWEKEKRGEQLEPINEVAVRAFFAGIFGVKLAGTFEGLIGEKRPRDMNPIKFGKTA